MLTPSVNVVQSAFPEELQGEISGLSRCVSNLGSSLGTAVAGTILVSGLTSRAYAAAMIVLRDHRTRSGSARRCSFLPGARRLASRPPREAVSWRSSRPRRSTGANRPA